MQAISGGAVLTYKKIPALAAYIDRIGAEELNFKRFMVKDYQGNHYYKERCVIKIEPNGDIKVTNKNYAPTEDEAKAIKESLVNYNFPRCIRASDGNFDELKQKLAGDTIFYEFWDRTEDNIIMVQQRTVIKGKKTFIPWTFWSDGEWRMMEPEQNLPFWKPRYATGKTRIMVHEGAKTAAFVHTLTYEHPWYEELKEYEHWGMIGGALAPHRTDYLELIKQKPTDVVYVCDNDYVGKSAISQISRNYGRSLRCIMFNSTWPESWDMADEIPECFFTGKSKRYTGPSVESLIRPATWATQNISDKTGKPVYALRSEFAEEWFHCITPDVYIHKDSPNHILNLSEFNDFVKPFSEVDDTARLVKSDVAIKSYSLKYNPAVKSGIFTDFETGERYINTHMPSNIKPIEGDYGPWLEFMAKLIPQEDDRNQLFKWVATLIAAPDIKMLYGVLLISEQQGVGKGTLGEKILAPIIGNHNVSAPSEGEIVEGNFNYWCAHKRLAIVHEIYAGNSSKAYNKLKSLITDKYITVSQKFQAPYQIENWLHIFACSNSMRALKLSLDDRRWFVPRVTEEKQTVEYWTYLNKWLRDDQGLSVIKQWAKEYIKEHGVIQKGEIAPLTTKKKEVIEEGFSPGMNLVATFLDRVKTEMPDQKVAILDTDLVKLIKDFIYDGRQSDKLERTATIRKLAKSKGWAVEKKWIKKTGGMAHVIASDPDAVKNSDVEILNIGPLADKWIEL